MKTRNGKNVKNDNRRKPTNSTPRSGSKTSSSVGKDDEGRSGDFYEPYLNEDIVNSCNYLRGYIRVNPRKKTEAYVTCEGIGVDIRVDDEKLRNRSLEGDLVALEILPEEQWTEFSAMLQSKLKLNESGEEEATLDSSEITLENEDLIHQSQERLRLWRPLMNIPDKTPTGEELHNDQKTGAMTELEIKSLRLGLQPRAKVVRILESKSVQGLIGGLELQPSLSFIECAPGDPLPHSVQQAYFKPSDSRYPSLHVPRASFPEHLLKSPHVALQQIYVADISEYWSPRSKYPEGKNLRSLGETGDLEVETKALLRRWDCDHGAFTEDVLGPLRDKLRQGMIRAGCSEGDNSNDADNGHDGDADTNDGIAHNWYIPREEIARRRDLRTHRIFTIDPPNAKDLDDALHITPLQDSSSNTSTGIGSQWGYDIPDKFEIGVHIADVSYFIEKDSALDEEAKKRATSVYLVQRVIPMLPAILCEQLCSLNPNVDRLAFSCIWQMHSDGSLVEGVEPWFGRTVIRSCAKLDYPTAQRMIDGIIPSSPSLTLSNMREGNPAEGEGGDTNVDEDAFLTSVPESVWEQWRRPPKKQPDGSPGHKAWQCARDVCYMHHVAANRRQDRLNNGSLVLTNLKLSFSLDSATGNPSGVTTYTIRDSNHLVEEYMLLANYLVAQELLLTFHDHAFIRSHGQPDPSKLRELVDVVKSLGFNLDISSSRSVQESLNHITRHAPPLVVKIVTNMLTKPIPEAQYRRSGLDPDGWQHYALAIPYYTHFTSPIRRYADVVVHRLLERSILIKSASNSTRDSTKGDGHDVPDQKSYAQELLEEIKSESSTIDLNKTATRCNEMKRASKEAQIRSDRVYLAVYLTPAHAGPTVVDGFVTGVGNKSFTVFVPDFGIDDRLFVDNMPFTQSSFDMNSRVLTLTRRPPKGPKQIPTGRAAERPNSLIFEGAAKIQLLSSVKVMLSTKTDAGPIDVVMSLVDVSESAPSLLASPRV